MSTVFSRRSFLKYTAVTAVAVAGAGLLTGCEIQAAAPVLAQKLRSRPPIPVIMSC